MKMQSVVDHSLVSGPRGRARGISDGCWNVVAVIGCNCSTEGAIRETQ
jgi:hypothetical protein